MSTNVDTIVHATPLQHGMLHHALRDPASGLYVEQFSCVLAGPLDVARFRDAWQAAIQRHDVLKTLFIRLDEERPMQVVRRQVALPFVHARWDGDDPARFEALLAADRARGFDPASAPLMRLHLVEVGAQRHRFVWTYHHAILDGWSMPILLDEVFARYAGAAPRARAPASDYRHYVAWLRRQDRAAARDFWTAQLAGYREPLRFAPSMQPRGDAAPRPRATLHDALPPGWVEQATARCRAARVTLNTLCQAAWAALLALYGDRDDVVHGTVVSGRAVDLPGIETMVGLFINTLPVRVRLPAEQPLREWLREVQSDTQHAERHAHSPLAEALQCAEVPRAQPLFDAIYVFENYPGQEAFRATVAAHGLAVEDARAVEETHYGLALVVLPVDGLALRLTVDARRFGEAAAQRLLAQYRALLERLLERMEDGRVRDLRLDATVAASTSARASGGPDASLAALVARHAAAAPERAAWVGGDGIATTSRAWHAQVVHARRRWRELGYRAGDRVLLCCDDDDVLALAMLVAGLAHGIDCLLPDPAIPPHALAAAGPAAWGREGIAGCVATAARRIDAPGLRCDVIAREAVEASDEGGDAQAPEALHGAVSLLARDADGAWTLLRHDHGALVQAVAAFADACPVAGTRDVPLAGPAVAPDGVWTALMALGNGLTLHRLAEAADPFAALAATGRPWHSVRLDAAATRRLGRLPAGRVPRADHWLADAASLTEAGARRLHALAGEATLLRELRWPAHSLPHARARCAGATLPAAVGVPVAGTTLAVVDRQLRPAALDARGRLLVSGASVPALRRDGAADHRAWLAGADGPQLLTDLCAWAVEAGCEAALPHATAAVDAPWPDAPALEAALASQAGVQALALADRLADDRDWQPTLYVVPAPDSAPDALATALQARAAALGLADVAVVEVGHLPPSARGVDRRALVAGAVAPLKRAAPRAPRDAVETALHALWSALLKRERIGLDDDWFALGGDSLLAAVMLAQVEEKLGAAVDMEALLEAPTLAALAEAIRGGGAAAATRAPPDLAAEAVLDADIVPSGPPANEAPQHVLLTGATGFLGVHLLAELLTRTPAQVHCLVRAADAAQGHRRLVEALRSHALWSDAWADRVVAVPGELDRPRLGLAPERFDALARTVDAIYHNGALVNFVYPYRALKPVNVLATQDVLRLACLHRTKPVHYISTVGVLDRTADAIPEVLSVPLHRYLMGGYEQSKWVAEQLVVAAAARGLPVAIYRPSRIVGHSRTGRINTDDLFCRLIQGIARFGKAPRDVGFDNILPVDLAARLVVEASLHREVHGHAVHVVNPQWNPLDAVVDAIEAEGHAVERLPYGDWLEQLAAHVRRDPGHPLAMLLPVLRKLDPVADPTVGRQLPIAHAHLERWAGEALREGLRPVDEWLKVFFDRFHESGWLRSPARTAEAA